MWINEKILWGLIEKSEFRRGVMKKPIYRGDCLKRELGQFADLKGGLAKRRVMVFLRRIPRCVTRGWGRRRGRGGGGEREKDLSCSFSKFGKKCPNFGG